MIRMPARLFRMNLSLMNGVAAVGGCLLAPLPPGGGAVAAAFAGVTLLAMGASAGNQLLERDLDALMQRTMGRPLPRRAMQPRTAALLGFTAAACGFLLLAAVSLTASLLGLAALAWYLAVYTPLKRRTPLALLFGALSGALPPVIGWTLAGGSMSDFRVVLLAGLFFLWQVPHFWLFQQRHADDYRRAGIPLFTITPASSGLWVVALALGTLLLPLFGVVGHACAPWFGLLALILPAIWLSRSEPARRTCLNLFPLLITLALLAPH